MERKYKIKLNADQILFLVRLLDESEHKDFKSLHKRYLKIIKKRVEAFKNWNES